MNIIIKYLLRIANGNDDSCFAACEMNGNGKKYEASEKQFHGILTAVSLKMDGKLSWGRIREHNYNFAEDFWRMLQITFIYISHITYMQCIELSGHISWVNRFNLSHNVLHINCLNSYDSCSHFWRIIWMWMWMCIRISINAYEIIILIISISWVWFPLLLKHISNIQDIYR